MPSTFDAIQVALLFLIPGYIIDQIVSRAMPRSARGNNEALLNYVWLSLLSLILTSPLFVTSPYAQPSWQFVRLLVSLVLVPALLGVLIVAVIKRAGQWKWAQRVANALSRILFIHPTPKAWDWFFAQGRCCWVLVTLGDGSRIGGKLGGNSFASSYPAPEDIYIEQVWKLSDTGAFVEPIERSLGVLIKGEKIQHIEFFE